MPSRHVYSILIALLAVFIMIGDMLAEVTDPSISPIYSKYDFGRNLKTINIGIQPFYVPSGVLAEVMKRDRILKSSISKYGWGIRFHSFLKGADINYFMEHGDIDAAFSGDGPVISAAVRSDIMIAALAQQNLSSLISNREMLLINLRNKRIGYTPDSTALYAFYRALSFTDIRDDDVIMLPYDITELAEALSQSKIDAFVSWEPVTSITLKAHPEFTITLNAMSSGYFYMRRSFAVEQRELAETLTASLLRALSWLGQNPDNIVLASGWTLQAESALKGRPVDLPADRIAYMVSEGIVDLTTFPVIPESSYSDHGELRNIFDLMKEKQKIPHDASWEKVLQSIDRTILDAIAAAPLKYRINEFDYEN